MIHRTEASLQDKSWQEELQQLIRCPKTLIQRLNLDAALIPDAIKVSTHFPLKLTESYFSRIKKGDPKDPLLLQVLPVGIELDCDPSYSKDPLEEKEFQPAKGLIHKYQSRVLFIAATQCAIHCRYCFRRHFPYDQNQLNKEQWHEALDYISNTDSINEVILSGGDPLSIADKQLSWLTKKIAEIPHITRLRIHTRYPIILPKRITPKLTAALSHTRLKIIMVIHCNHPQEIDTQVTLAISRLKAADITVFNQAVLLKGINDDSQILRDLSETLFQSGVLPYYLHLLDKVAGAKHFSVNEARARTIYKELLTLLPGYLVPKLVKELPFESSKTPINL